MTKKQEKQEAETPKEAFKSSLPEGFRSLAAAQVRDFHICEMGNAITGLFLGYFTKARMDGKPQGYFQLQVTKEGTKVSHYDEDGADAEMEAEIGTIVNLDEKAGLKGLYQFAMGEGKAGRWVVYACPDAKVAIGGGKTFWLYSVGTMPAPSDLPF